MTGPLAAAFLARAAAAPLPLDALEQRLHACHAAGRAAFPGIDVAPERLAAHLGALAAAVDDPADWLARLHADGLYLACACAGGQPRAIAIFEERLLSQAPMWLGRLGLPPATLAEVLQQVRARLFVGEGGAAPKIAEYSGEGPLGAWLRVVLQRTALSLLRRREDAPLDPQAADEAALGAAPDPELDVIRARYRDEFAAAFRDALRAQSSETRNLLRLHFLDGLTIDKLAPLFQVHRATVARWLQTARESVLDETLRLLRARLNVPAAELQSLVRLLKSDLDVSLSGALKSKAE